MFEFLLGLQSGGLNLVMIVGIIGILQLVKTLDKKKVLKKDFYLIAVLAGGVLAGVLVAEHTLKGFIVATVAHAGVASILYQYGKKILPSTGSKFQLFQKGAEDETG